MCGAQRLRYSVSAKASAYNFDGGSVIACMAGGHQDRIDSGAAHIFQRGIGGRDGFGSVIRPAMVELYR